MKMLNYNQHYLTVKKMKNMKNSLKILLVLMFFANVVNSANWKAKHVVLIGLDGWASYGIKLADMPNAKKMMVEGSYTLKKRSVFPSASTENWASMFMGVGPELHGYYSDGGISWRAPLIEPRVKNKNGVFPTVFSLLREAYPKAEIGSIYQWEGIQSFIDTKAMSYCQQVPSEEPIMCDMAVKYIKEKKPALLLLYWDNPDDIGHDKGWYTPDYYKVMKILDGNIGRIVQALKECGILDDTIIIITADHGGTGRGHGGTTLLEMETPFIIYGKDIKKGHVIEGSMMQYDVAATVAAIFNLKQPQVWVGRPMTEVFAK
jgi:predicted AlkP superfamily pyrophosphatase or phosphodiesterase